MKQLLILGPFPPPVQGAALVTCAFAKQAKSYCSEMTEIDLSGSGFATGLSRLSRMPKCALALRQLLAIRANHSTLLYLALSANWGQLYDLAFLLMARIKKWQVAIHHHSYRYLDRSSFLTRLCFGVASSNTRHLVLSHGMATKLKDRYGQTLVTVVIHNANFVHDPGRENLTLHRPLRNVGYISRLERAKGINTFLDLALKSHQDDLHLNFLIAGQATNTEMMERLKATQRAVPNINYWGTVQGDEKDRFFRSIDVLVFPTTYDDEAAPMVIYEALAYGVPVISFDRGTISEIIDETCGLVMPSTKPFVSQANLWLKDAIRDPIMFGKARTTARQRFDVFTRQAQEQIAGFFEITSATQESASSSRGV